MPERPYPFGIHSVRPRIRSYPPHRSLHIWQAWRGTETVGYVFVDEVVGRQDFITYALGIDAQATGRTHGFAGTAGYGVHVRHFRIERTGAAISAGDKAAVAT